MTTTITAHSQAVPSLGTTSTHPAARDLITFPVICVYLWTFIHIGRPQDVFEVLKVIRPGNIAAGLTVLSFLLWGEKDKKFFSLPETKLFLLFFVIALLFGFDTPCFFVSFCIKRRMSGSQQMFSWFLYCK